MAQWTNLIPAMIGLTVQGDLAGWTFYTSSRGQIVFYPSTPALQPATIDQAVFRNKMRTAAFLWKAITPGARSQWNEAVTRGRLLVQGYHLFTWYHFKQDPGPIRTLEHNFNLTLIHPDGSVVY